MSDRHSFAADALPAQRQAVPEPLAPSRLILPLSELDAPWPRYRSTARKRLVWDDRLSLKLVDWLWRDAEGLVGVGERLKDDVRTTVVRLPGLEVLHRASAACGADGRSLEVGESRCVLKRFNCRGPFHTATHAALPTRAWRGWHFARLLRRHGVLTPAALAYLEERIGPLRFRSYLLTESVAGRLLHDLIQDWRKVPPWQWSLLADQVSDLWTAFSQLKILHGDLKATNFIVDAQCRLWLIDLDACRQTLTRAGWRVGFHKEHARFLKNFANCPELAELFKARAKQLRSFSQKPAPDWSGSTVWVTSDPEMLPDRFEVEWERLQCDPGADLLRRVDGRENWRVVLAAERRQGRIYYLKRHRQAAQLGPTAAPPGPLEAAITLQLQRDQVPTMDVVAAGVLRSPKCEESFLLTKELTGYVQLDHYLKKEFQAGASWRTPRLAELIACVARVARKFHDAGYNHRDLYCCHFFVRECGGSFDVRLIDLQRVQRREFRRRRWLVKDLAQLSYSAPRNCIGCKERILFARHYFGVRRLGPDHKKLLRSVARKHRLMEAKLGPHP